MQLQGWQANFSFAGVPQSKCEVIRLWPKLGIQSNEKKL